MRTNDPYLTAVFATACRLLGLHFPGNIPVEVTKERIDADPEMQPVLEDVLTRFSHMWGPWAEFAPPASGAATILDHLPFSSGKRRPRPGSRQRQRSCQVYSKYGSYSWWQSQKTSRTTIAMLTRQRSRNRH